MYVHITKAGKNCVSGGIKTRQLSGQLYLLHESGVENASLHLLNLLSKVHKKSPAASGKTHGKTALTEYVERLKSLFLKILS